VVVVDLDAPECSRRQARAVRYLTRTVLTEEGAEDARVELALMPPPVLRELNRRYRGRDKETNVLAFPGERLPLTPASRTRYFGAVAVAPAVACAEARAYGLEPGERLAWVMIHGLLHLCGYDHARGARAAACMAARERAYLAHLSPMLRPALQRIALAAERQA